MAIRILLAVLHLLAFGIGLGAVWSRSRSLKSEPLDRPTLKRIFRADAWWGVAAGLWLVTGLIRFLGGYEKPTAFYLHNPLFHVKLALFLLIVAIELKPMMTLMKWRKQVAKGETVDTSSAKTLAVMGVAQAHLVVVIVIVAVALARGLGGQ